MQERAIHGADVIMQPDRANKVLETNFVSERIMKTRLKYEHRNETIIQIYTLHHAMTPTRKRRTSSSRNYLAQLTQYQTMISSSWETSMEG